MLIFIKKEKYNERLRIHTTDIIHIVYLTATTFVASKSLKITSEVTTHSFISHSSFHSLKRRRMDGANDHAYTWTPTSNHHHNCDEDDRF